MEKTAEQSGRRKVVRGVVTSAKMQKTIVVGISRRMRHPDFEKYLKRSVVLKAHDEKGEARAGDEVDIEASRPLSRTKRWRLLRIVRRAEGDGGVAPGALTVEAQSQVRRAAKEKERAERAEKRAAQEAHPVKPVSGGESDA